MVHSDDKSEVSYYDLNTPGAADAIAALLFLNNDRLEFRQLEK